MDVRSLLSGPKPTATHALVNFGDEGTTIVPFSRIMEGSTSKGMCRVKWNDGGEYDGELIVAGNGLLKL